MLTRAAYEQLGKSYTPGQDFRPPPDWDAGFEFSGRGFSPHEAAEFSDFFAELFGRMGRHGGVGAGSHDTHFRARGEDHHAKVLLDLEDAFTGATRQITLRAPELDAHGLVQLRTRTLNVKIPRGVRAGQIIRLAGQGAPGLGGAPAGDLLLEVHFRPHSRLSAEGRDLRLSLPVAPWEAALGAVVTVDLPGGSLKVRIPEGTQSGRMLRVRGRGVRRKDGTKGDLVVTIDVAVPARLSAEARDALKAYAESTTDHDPRGELLERARKHAAGGAT